MCRLRGRDQIHAVIGQAGRLGGSGDAGEFRILLQKLLSRAAHFRVRLDSEDPISVFEQKTREDASA